MINNYQFNFQVFKVLKIRSGKVFFIIFFSIYYTIHIQFTTVSGSYPDPDRNFSYNFSDSGKN